jgi:5'-nucleotidase (lipoprotein e(P4) family)
MRGKQKTTRLVVSLVALLFVFPAVSAAAQDNASKAICANPLVEQNVSATLWLMSAENRALCLQTYNLATMIFDKARAEYKGQKKLAIVLDIDDTIIDSTSYTAGIILGKPWTGDAWAQWIGSNSVALVPGAREYLGHVVAYGGEVFYVTNRGPELKDDTLISLMKLGLPYPDAGHLYIREKGAPSSKESRRQSVQAGFEVVSFLGDNLEDFSDAFAPAQGIASREKAVLGMREAWGSRFIVFANPMYGDWEKAIVNAQKGLTVDQTMAKRVEAFKANQ